MIPLVGPGVPTTGMMPMKKTAMTTKAHRILLVGMAMQVVLGLWWSS